MQVQTLLPVPDLWTPRLWIRAFQDGDQAGIFGYASDPETARYMVWPRHKSLADSEATLRYLLDGYLRRDDLPLAILRRSDGQLIGCTGFQYPLRRIPWMAWMLRPDAFGQGYGQEAAQAALKWGWRAFPKWTHVEAPIHPKNQASIALARKLGFVQVPSELRFKMTNLNGRMARATNWSVERPR